MTPDDSSPQESPIRVGVTLGDPGGVGPEIIGKALPRIVGANVAPVVFGHRHAVESFRPVSIPDGGSREAVLAELDFVEPEIPYEPVPVGKASAAGGRLSLAYVEHAIRAALTSGIDALVTGPVSKESWALAGSSYRGHTLLLQDRCAVPRSVMMLLNPRLRVSLVTHHVPLRAVPGAITAAAVEETVRITADGLLEMGVSSPRIAVAGLNPHAGEEGLLGNEEIEHIAPAVRVCQGEGMQVSGPFPGDTVFHRAAAGEFDAVVAMYHDQGLAPLKALSFADTVNVTLGLPIVRTSVGHGTAFDLASRGCADPSSLLAAVSLAAVMARHRRAARKQRGNRQ